MTKASHTRSTSLTTGQFQFRKKKEKSTAILVSIVVLFVLCHSYRLCLKIYEFAMPSSHVMDTFTYCFHQQRYIFLPFPLKNMKDYSILLTLSLVRNDLSFNGMTSLPFIFRAKGDLISKTCFLWHQSLKKVPNHYSQL